MNDLNYLKSLARAELFVHGLMLAEPSRWFERNIGPEALNWHVEDMLVRFTETGCVEAKA